MMPPHKARLLVVDDDVGSIKLMSRILAGLGELQFATRGGEALRLAREAPPALILLDAEMPGMNGFDVLEALKAEPSLAHIPVIIVTCHSDQRVEVAGFEAGAADFIAKPLSAPLLQARVKTQLRLVHLADELRRSATVDGLTNVANRRRFDDVLRNEWQRAWRAGDALSMMMIDVDHFKLFNDRYGHAAGDACLQRVAAALQAASLRTSDLVARYGGEEFAVVLPQTPRAGAGEVAARVVAAVSALAIQHAGSPTAAHVTVSVGVTSYDRSSAAWIDPVSRAPWPDDARVSAEHFIGVADAALYAAKQAGRGRARFLDVAEVEVGREPPRGHSPTSPPLAVTG
jgi:diguanylate cyclase (GGDEF)-like protein